MNLVNFQICIVFLSHHCWPVPHVWTMHQFPSIQFILPSLQMMNPPSMSTTEYHMVWWRWTDKEVLTSLGIKKKWLIWWYLPDGKSFLPIWAACQSSLPGIQKWSSEDVHFLKFSLVANKTFCQCELQTMYNGTLSVLLPHQILFSEPAIHSVSIHYYSHFTFTGNWIPQNNAFQYVHTIHTCILNMLSKVQVEIWYI